MSISIESDRPCAADAGRNLAGQGVGERLLDRSDVIDREPGQHRAHAARDVESNASSRDDAALVRIECRDAPDREAVTPMRVGHGIGGLYDPWKRRHIDGLLEDLVIHVADQIFIGVNDRRHPHRALRLNPPCRGVDLSKTSRVHVRPRLYVHYAAGRPGAVQVLGDSECRIGRAFGLAGGGMALHIDRLTPQRPCQPLPVDPYGEAAE